MDVKKERKKKGKGETTCKRCGLPKFGEDLRPKKKKKRGRRTRRRREGRRKKKWDRAGNGCNHNNSAQQIALNLEKHIQSYSIMMMIRKINDTFSCSRQTNLRSTERLDRQIHTQVARAVFAVKKNKNKTALEIKKKKKISPATLFFLVLAIALADILSVRHSSLSFIIVIAVVKYRNKCGKLKWSSRNKWE